MFNDKEYIEVNREERFYCFLLAHTLLSSESARNSFKQIWRERFSPGLAKDTPLEVFVEAAALRDYWYDLGDHRKYTGDTHTARRQIVAAALVEEGKGDAIIHEHDFFWSSPRREKLLSPGRWNETQLRSAALDSLMPLKWAFNAKPDLLLICGSEVLIIEAKIESGEGRSAAGYSQNTTQLKIAMLLHCWFRDSVPAISKYERSDSRRKMTYAGTNSYRLSRLLESMNSHNGALQCLEDTVPLWEREDN